MMAEHATGTLEQALAHAERLLARDPVLAGEQAAEILKIVAGHPMALRVLALARAAQDDLQGAIDILAPLAQVQPTWALVHLDLGVALGHSGQGQAAITALRKAVALKPELPQAWRELGDLLMAAGEHDVADAAYAQHVRHSTRDPGLLAAAAALVENRIPEAEARLREHLRQAPTDVAAIRMFAELAARQGRNEDALGLLAQCLELAPGFHAARQNYALLLHRSNQSEQALAEIERLLAVAPGHPGYRNLKAAVLCRIGDYEPAIGIYADLLEQHPAQPEGLDELRPRAEDGRAAATVRSPPIAAASSWSRPSARPGGASPTSRPSASSADDLAAMRAQLARADAGRTRRSPAPALRARQGAGGRRRLRSLVPSTTRRAMRSGARSCATTPTTPARACATSRARFTPRVLRRARRRRVATARDPIFIVGLPRSGSTLIEQILASHSPVEGTMELPDIISIARALRTQRRARRGAPIREALAALERATSCARWASSYLARTRIQRKTGAPFFIDKMPNNFLHVGLIQLILPNAKIIDARRHPLAAAFPASSSTSRAARASPTSLDDLGRYYRDYVDADGAFRRRAARPRPPRHLRATWSRTPRARCAACWTTAACRSRTACLRFYENERPVRTASSEQVRQPIFREGVDHWRHYEPGSGR